MYMDDIKIFAKTEKGRDLDANNKNVQPENRNGIWHWKLYHAHKRETMKEIEQPNQESIKILERNKITCT